MSLSFRGYESHVLSNLYSLKMPDLLESSGLKLDPIRRSVSAAKTICELNSEASGATKKARQKPGFGVISCIQEDLLLALGLFRLQLEFLLRLLSVSAVGCVFFGSCFRRRLSRSAAAFTLSSWSRSFLSSFGLGVLAANCRASSIALARRPPKRSMASACCCKMRSGSAILFDQNGDLWCGLRSNTQPVINSFTFENRPSIGLGNHGIIGSQFFDHPTVSG